MKTINAGYEILTPLDGSAILKHIEQIGRVCYKSEDKITDDSAPKFVKMLINRGHEAMIEHFSFSVKFICDRGVTHEIVRHRIASFAQESTRYCNYGNSEDGCTFIAPCFWNKKEPMTKGRLSMLEAWEDTILKAEFTYLAMIDAGASPQEARSVLPNSLKTEIVMTANLREWRHFLKLRTASTAHPQMQEITRPLLDELKSTIPVVFDDVQY